MPRSRGFTLIEVVVALALAAIVVLLAERVFGAVVDATVRIEQSAERLEAAANARRLLAALVGSLEVTAEIGGFAGEPHAVTFTTWHPSSGPWPQRRRVAIEQSSSALVVLGPDSVPVVLMDSVGSLDLDYLLGLGAEQRWVRNWSSALSEPTALRLRIQRSSVTDTLLLIVGGRR